MLYYYFSLEAILLLWLKITEKQIDLEIQAALKQKPAWKLTEDC